MTAFTVAIPVYNGAAFLEDALASIARQDLNDLEVLVSDNASTDRTPELLAEWSSRLPLRVVRRPRTLGMRDHFNALLDDVDGDAYMMLCHDDYFATPDALAKARKVLADHPEVSAVYCDLLYVDERGRRLSRRSFGRSGLFTAKEAGLRSLRTGRNCFGIPLAVRREALGSNRYDEQFLYTMDIELSWQTSCDAPAWHIPEALIANRYSASNSTWAMHGSARREYVDLTTKHVGEPGRAARMRIAATCAAVAAQKLLFKAYERSRSWRS